MKPYVANIILVVGSLISAIFIAELSANYLGYKGEFSKSGLFFPTNSSFGLEWLGKEHHDTVETYNKLLKADLKLGETVSLNGISYNVEKTEGVKRVFFIGDSGTYGIGVDREFTFYSRVKEQFGGSGVEFINVGIPAFGPIQSFNQLKRSLMVMKPDSVVYGFFMANDIQDILTHQFVDAWNKNLINPDNFPVLKKFALFNMLNLAYAKWSFNFEKETSNIQTKNIPLHDENGVNLDHNQCTGRYFAYKKNLAEPLQEAWKVFEAQLFDFKNFLKNKGIKFSILIIPTHTTIGNKFLFMRGYDHVSCLKNAGLEVKSSTIDPQFPARKILSICKSLAVDCIDPSKEITEKLRLNFFNYNDDHPSVEGHKLLFDQLTKNKKFWHP